MINKNILKRIIIMLLLMGICVIASSNQIVNAASYSSDINGIDESKYPGYKDKINELKKIYPNIQIFYTGLDWNTVIENERVHSRNLVPKEYGEEWRCEVCGDKTYDSGWYCASDAAVAYLMDPRVYLTNTGIFQFQKLDTSVRNFKYRCN